MFPNSQCPAKHDAAVSGNVAERIKSARARLISCVCSAIFIMPFLQYNYHKSIIRHSINTKNCMVSRQTVSRSDTVINHCPSMYNRPTQGYCLEHP